MKVIINIDGQALSVEVTVEVYEYLDRADHKEENLAHEKRRHWDSREFGEYIVLTEGFKPRPDRIRAALQGIAWMTSWLFYLRFQKPVTKALLTQCSPTEPHLQPQQ